MFMQYENVIYGIVRQERLRSGMASAQFVKLQCSLFMSSLVTPSLKEITSQTDLNFDGKAQANFSIGFKSRKENSKKLTQLSSRSHPRHLVGKKDSTKDTIIDITSDSQVNSNFPNRWSPASLKARFL